MKSSVQLGVPLAVPRAACDRRVGLGQAVDVDRAEVARLELPQKYPVDKARGSNKKCTDL